MTCSRPDLKIKSSILDNYSLCLLFLIGGRERGLNHVEGEREKELLGKTEQDGATLDGSPFKESQASVMQWVLWRTLATLE